MFTEIKENAHSHTASKVKIQGLVSSLSASKTLVSSGT